MIGYVVTPTSHRHMVYCFIRMFLFIYIVLTILRGTYQQRETVCAGVENGRFVRNSASCQSYYLCQGGEGYANNCPRGLYFNAAEQMCDEEERVDCTQCSPFGIQQLPHLTDCAKYYLCVSGIRTMRICGSGLSFDPRFGDCNLQRLVDCVSVPDHSSICTPFAKYGFVVIGDREDCTRYYFCLNGVTYPEKCAPNLYFNPDKGYCELPAVYDYCQGPGEIVIPPAYTTTTTSTTTTTTTTSTTTRASSTSTTTNSGNSSSSAAATTRSTAATTRSTTTTTRRS